MARLCREGKGEQELECNSVDRVLSYRAQSSGFDTQKHPNVRVLGACGPSTFQEVKFKVILGCIVSLK